MPLTPPSPSINVPVSGLPLPGNVQNSVVDVHFEEARNEVEAAIADLSGFIGQINSFLAGLQSLTMTVDDSALTMPNRIPATSFSGTLTSVTAPDDIPPGAAFHEALDPLDTPQPTSTTSIEGINTDLTPVTTGPVTITHTPTAADLTEPAWSPSLQWDIIGLLRGIPTNPVSATEIANLGAPQSFSFAEDPYVSSLLTNIRTRLNDILVNGGGALAAVESDIFDRETERDVLVNQDAMEKVADIYAQRGFPFAPPGFLDALTQVQTEYQNARLTKSRLIAEESRKTEIDMEKNALMVGAQLEGVTQSYWDKLNDRALQAASKIVEEGLAVLEFGLKKILGKLEIFSKEIDAYQVYAGMHKSVADTDIALLNAEATNEELKIKVKMANKEIEAGNNEADLKANIAETELNLKIDLNADQMKMAEVEANVKKITAIANIIAMNNDLAIKVSSANAEYLNKWQEGYDKHDLSEAEKIKINAENQSKIALTNAELQKLYQESLAKWQMSEAENARVNLESVIKYVTTKLQVAVAEFEGRFKKITADENVNMELLKTMVQATVQRIASAMSTVYASAGLSVGTSSSVSVNQSASESWNHSLNTNDEA